MVKLPDDIAETLVIHWPKQFTVDEGTTPTAERVFARGLQSFARSVSRIMDKGVDVEQILAALDQLANEPGYRRLDRGAVLKRLWALAPSERAPEPPKPVREHVAHPAASQGSPAMRAIRAHADTDDLIAEYPWFGQPSQDGKYRRNIDRPFWQEMRASVRTIGGGA